MRPAGKLWHTIAGLELNLSPGAALPITHVSFPQIRTGSLAAVQRVAPAVVL